MPTPTPPKSEPSSRDRRAHPHAVDRKQVHEEAVKGSGAVPRRSKAEKAKEREEGDHERRSPGGSAPTEPDARRERTRESANGSNSVRQRETDLRKVKPSKSRTNDRQVPGRQPVIETRRSQDSTESKRSLPAELQADRERASEAARKRGGGVRSAKAAVQRPDTSTAQAGPREQKPPPRPPTQGSRPRKAKRQDATRGKRKGGGKG